MILLLYLILYFAIGLLVWIVDTFIDGDWYADNLVTVRDAIFIIPMGALLWPLALFQMIRRLANDKFGALLDREINGWWR